MSISSLLYIQTLQKDSIKISFRNELHLLATLSKGRCFNFSLSDPILMSALGTRNLELQLSSLKSTANEDKLWKMSVDVDLVISTGRVACSKFLWLNSSSFAENFLLPFLTLFIAFCQNRMKFFLGKNFWKRFVSRPLVDDLFQSPKKFHLISFSLFLQVPCPGNKNSNKSRIAKKSWSSFSFHLIK